MAEILTIVDAENNVIGDAPYDEVYSQKLNHRIVHVMIFNEKGEVYLQQRSATKSFCPGHWVTSAGGHVQKDEPPEQAAARELEEELGVAAPLRQIHNVCYETRGMKKFLSIFSTTHNGPFKHDPVEVAGGRFFSINEVRSMVKKNELVHPELSFVIKKLYP